MKLRIDLSSSSKKEWVDVVMKDFDSFLQDHADCERKASAMALSFVAKYPNRIEILPQLIDTAIEELEHFKEVYTLMQKRNIPLRHEIIQDVYMKKLLDVCRSGREERFMDRLLLASLVETRGAERFKLIYEAMEDTEIKQFYQKLWASEAKHGEIFVSMALNYFEKPYVYERLEGMKEQEKKILDDLPIKPQLH